MGSLLIDFIYKLPIQSLAFVNIFFYIISFSGFYLISGNEYLNNIITRDLIFSFIGIFIGSSYYLNKKFFKLRITYIRKQIEKNQGKIKFLFYYLFIVWILNYFLNSNFASFSSTVRFQSISFPILHWLKHFSIIFQPFLLLLIIIKKPIDIFKNKCWLLFNFQTFLSYLSISTSKGILLNYLLIVFSSLSIYTNSVTLLNIKNFIVFLKRICLKATINKKILRTNLIFGLLIIISTFFLLQRLNITSLLLRLTLGQDQLLLLSSALNSNLIQYSDNHETLNQPIFFLYWFKSFLRPFFPFLYNIHDNYSEFLIDLYKGRLTLDWSQTGHAPNNSIFTDFFLFSPSNPYLQSLFSFIYSFSISIAIVRCLINFLFNPWFKSISSCISFSFLGILYSNPLLPWQDSQAFFMFLICSTALILIVLSIISKLTYGKIKNKF